MKLLFAEMAARDGRVCPAISTVKSATWAMFCNEALPIEADTEATIRGNVGVSRAAGVCIAPPHVGPSAMGSVG